MEKKKRALTCRHTIIYTFWEGKGKKCQGCEM